MRPGTTSLRSALVGLIALIAPLLTAAQSGSMPYYDYDESTLVIPRIDVEDFGALRVRLQLLDERALTFTLLEAVPTETSIPPAATYNLTSQELSVPLANIEFEFFDLKFRLQPGDVFQLVLAEPTTLPGQSEYSTQCATCHGIDGSGGAVGVSLVNCSNCGSRNSLTAYIDSVMPLGQPQSCSADCASDVADYIFEVFQVDDSPMVAQTLAALEILPLEETLRKASLNLVSRLPTDAELALVGSGGTAGLETVLDGMMQEPEFYERLIEIFNDLLHTDRYLEANSRPGEALNLMRPFPTALWFDPGQGSRDRDFFTTLQITNDSVAREPLQLINHVVKNELPMTEILTADYFMVNGFSAKSYGIFDQLDFQDEWDPDEWLPARLTGIPHAGLMTSLMFLNRYPSSDTNRNRARSRVVYDLFLDVDILALEGSRPDGEAVDISSPAPTLDNDDCVVCHSLLDPVASSFENWSQRGFYRPFQPWYDDMFQAGFAGKDRPPEQEFTSLQWLADEIAHDPRFDEAIVRIVYNGLTGREPLDPPGPMGTEAAWDAYQAESVHLDELKADYVANNRNLKSLIKAIVLSPYWRANGLADDAFSLVHEDSGSARLLPLEILHRRISALLGFEWRVPLNFYSVAKDLAGQARLLDDRNFYHQIYGGIDSFVITERLTEPNGLMVAVQERMANELACYAVPNDFLAASDERLLFPWVDSDTLPVSTADQDAIRRNLQHLHNHLLGEQLGLDDPELDFTYQLFSEVLALGHQNLGVSETPELPPLCRRNRDLETGDPLPEPLTTDPNYVIRAWMATVAYLLSDYRFVYD